MKLYMKQKVFSFTDKFSVTDEYENSKYFVEGELFTFGKKLHIFNDRLQEVAFIKQKILSFFPSYSIEMGGEVVASLVKDFSIFTPSYHVEGLPWKVEGDLWSRNYVMNDGRFDVMRLSKAWLSWGDSYELEILDPMNEILCLSIALAIDCAIEQSKYNN